MLAETLKKNFEINLNDYENIGINLQINKVLLIAFIAFTIVAAFLNVFRMNSRLMIVQLFRHGAKSEEEAKTLEELGLNKNFFIKYLLSGSNLLSKTVGRIGEKKYTYDEYVALDKKERRENEMIDFDTERFYIKEEENDRALHISEKYDSTVLRTVITCVFILIVYACISAMMPELLRIINNLLERPKM